MMKTIKMLVVFSMSLLLILSLTSCKKKDKEGNSSETDTGYTQSSDVNGASEEGGNNTNSGNANVTVKVDEYGGTITTTEKESPIEFKPEVIDDIFEEEN